MKRFLAGLVLMATSMPAFAQSATGVGTGVASSSSTAQSQSVAIGGGNASSASQGGKGGKGVGISAVSINSNVPSDQTLRNVPTAFAPGLTSAGLETCLGSVSGGASAVGWGASFGTTVPDPGCAARLDARTLWSMGLRKAAVIRLCLMADIYRSMPEICALYMPQQPAYVGAAYASAEPAAYASATAPENTGGPIEVIEGKTGKVRMCSDYDAVKQKCHRWARADSN
jgi:hypothetical protein